MSFAVSADAYDRFMGRYSDPLARSFVELVDARPGQRAVDVGCGPGALTSVLAERLGPSCVAAVEPSASFLAAVRTRLPDVDVREAEAEQLPFEDGTFDLGLAQLVVPFMAEPVTGLRELARVTRSSGIVAASAWDHAGGHSPLSVFWRAVADLDPAEHDESDQPGTQAGGLLTLFEEAGLHRAVETILTVRVSFASAAEWWTPFTLGVGPAGGYLATLDADHRAAVRARCAELLPDGAFVAEARAWTVTAQR